MAQTIATVGLKKVSVHIPNAQNRLHFKNGRVVNDDGEFDADIYIEDGVIRQLGQNLTVPGGVRSIDIRGQLVFPAGIDTSTRFVHESNGHKTLDSIYSGTRSAIRGGTTVVLIDLRRSDPSETLVAAAQRVIDTVSKEACCNFALQVVLDRVDEPTVRELETIVRDYGIGLFHVDTSIFTDEQLIYIFQLARSLGALVRCSSQNNRLINALADAAHSDGLSGAAAFLRARPEHAELAAASRAIAASTALLDGACPLLIGPVASRRVSKLVARARRDGLPVFADVACAALADGTARRGALFSDPPVRSGVDSACRRDEPIALTNLLAVGDLATVCSHHAAFKLATQQAALDAGAADVRQIPIGVGGVAERLSVVLEYGVKRGFLDRSTFVRATSSNAARLLGLYPRRGRVAVGSEGDLLVWNPRGVTHFDDGASLYEGVAFTGAVTYLVANGRVVVDEAEVRVGQGWGKYERCVPFAPFVYARLDALATWQLSSMQYASSKTNDEQDADKLNLAVLPTEMASHNAGLLRLALPSGALLSSATTPASASALTSQASTPGSADIHKMATRSGVRNQQESSFSLSGAQIDDSKPFRPKIRTKQQSSQNSIW